MKPNRLLSIVTVLVLCIATQAQQPIAQITREEKHASVREETGVSKLLARAGSNSRRAFSLMSSSRAANISGSAISVTPMAAGPNLTVLGGGTLGRLTKWTGFTSSNSFIGDTTIFEDKFGKVGIGTDSPTSKLTVAGVIESTSEGFKFPDGTLQTSSAAGALFTVAHDATLTGDGTAASPLSVVQSNPADQPFQIALVPNSGFMVPAGKRLVIEYVGGFYAVPTATDQQPVDSIEIRTVIGSITVGHLVLSNRVSIDTTGFSIYHVGQNVRIYADPGTQVVPTGFATNTGTAQVTLSGHFVNVP